MKLVRVVGYGVITIAAARTLKRVGYHVVLTFLGPLGHYKLGSLECLQRLGAEARPLLDFIPFYRRVSHRIHVREEPRIVRNALTAALLDAIPLASPRTHLDPQPTLWIAACSKSETDSYTLPHGVNDAEACTVDAEHAIRVEAGGDMLIVPPTDQQEDAVCAALEGLGPHTAQHQAFLRSEIAPHPPG